MIIIHMLAFSLSLIYAPLQPGIVLCNLGSSKRCAISIIICLIWPDNSHDQSSQAFNDIWCLSEHYASSTVSPSSNSGSGISQVTYANIMSADMGQAESVSVCIAEGTSADGVAMWACLDASVEQCIWDQSTLLLCGSSLWLCQAVSCLRPCGTWRTCGCQLE